MPCFSVFMENIILFLSFSFSIFSVLIFRARWALDWANRYVRTENIFLVTFIQAYDLSTTVTYSSRWAAEARNCHNVSLQFRRFLTLLPWAGDARDYSPHQTRLMATYNQTSAPAIHPILRHPIILQRIYDLHAISC
jgi:hypothetical protein